MIQYTIEKKTVLTGANPSEVKFYPKIVRGATLNTKKVAALLQERTTLDIGEVYGFLLALSKGIRYYVTDSYTVEIDGLGIFTPTISAKSVESADELKASTITKKGVNYRPTSDMKSEYEQIKFVKANLESKGLM
jgi:predicted histone-like DNA-binding protein